MLKDGLRDINLVRLDPLHVNEVDIIQGNQSPVNINLNFKDVEFYGLSDVNVKKVVYVYQSSQVLMFQNHFRSFSNFFSSGFERDPSTSKFEIHANCAQLSLIARYKVNGKVIVLPVVGSGPANLTFGRFRFFPESNAFF